MPRHLLAGRGRSWALNNRSALEGRRVVVTRPYDQAESLTRGLETLGAIPVLLATIRVEPIDRAPGLDGAINELAEYDWVVFTSVNGVRFFCERLEAAGLSARDLADCSVAAIGPATASALQALAIQVDFVAEEHVGESLAEGLPDVAGSRVLLPRAAGARPQLPEILRGRGATVDEFAIYRAVEARPDDGALAEIAAGVDAITFTSPSTVEHFMTIVGSAGLDPFEAEPPPIVACIGPITADAAKSSGLRPAVVARDYTVPGLLEALTTFFERSRVHEQSA